MFVAGRGFSLKVDLNIENKKVNKGSYEIQVTTYYLTKHKASFRIEVRRLKMRNTTVEIELLHGDDVLILKKSYKIEILQSPTKKEIDAVVESLKKYASDNNFIWMTEEDVVFHKDLPIVHITHE